MVIMTQLIMRRQTELPMGFERAQRTGKGFLARMNHVMTLQLGYRSSLFRTKRTPIHSGELVIVFFEI